MLDIDSESDNDHHKQQYTKCPTKKVKKKQLVIYSYMDSIYVDSIKDHSYFGQKPPRGFRHVYCIFLIVPTVINGVVIEAGIIKLGETGNSILKRLTEYKRDYNPIKIYPIYMTTDGATDRDFHKDLKNKYDIHAPKFQVLKKDGKLKGGKEYYKFSQITFDIIKNELMKSKTNKYKENFTNPESRIAIFFTNINDIKKK